MRAYIDVLKKLDLSENLKPFGGKMKSPGGFRHIVKGTFGSECEPRGATTGHVGLVYLDVKGETS